MFLLSGIADEAADGLSEQLQVHQRLGWSHMELRNIQGKTIDKSESFELRKYAAQLRETEFQVSCLATDIGKLALGSDGQPFEVDIVSLGKMMAYAEQIGTRYIRVMGYQQGDVTEDRWRDEGIERLRILAGMAQEKGLVLVLENCLGWYARSGTRMRLFLERIGSNHCLCLFDTGNPVSYGIGTWDFYKAVSDYVAYVHVKDSNGPGQGFTYPGEGRSDVQRILSDLYNNSYQGYVSIEPHMAPSAHLPRLNGGTESAGTIYETYGRKLMKLVAAVCK